MMQPKCYCSGEIKQDESGDFTCSDCGRDFDEIEVGLRQEVAELKAEIVELKRGIACTTGDHDLHGSKACGKCFADLKAELKRLRSQV